MNAVDEIKHLYHNATKTTIQRDLTRAITLLKTLGTEEDRERVAVYMDGLSQMRSEWGVRPAPDGKTSAARRPASAGAKGATGSKAAGKAAKAGRATGTAAKRR